MLGQIREAVRLGKRIVLIHEQDSRFHAVDFGSEKNAAPDDLKVSGLPVDTQLSRSRIIR